MADWLAFNALALTLALLLDAMLGEPDWLWKRLPHPVVLIGKSIGFFDRRMNLDADSAGRRKRAGILALVAVLLLGGVLSGGLLAFAAWVHPALALIITVVLGGIFLAQRSLYDHVENVRAPLSDGDLPAARRSLAMIVGRNTQALDEEGVARAALESLAENHSDGVIAPAFWFLLGGLPGIALYKAINTADSMIGHRSDRHLHFGWAAANLDDWVNWVPARLSVGLIALGALGGQRLRYPAQFTVPSLARVRHDAPTHASPNAGWPEASYASALGVALGGPRTYPSGTVDAPYINPEGRKALTAADIRAGLLLFHATCAATIVLVFLIALIGA